MATMPWATAAKSVERSHACSASSALLVRGGDDHSSGPAVVDGPGESSRGAGAPGDKARADEAGACAAAAMAPTSSG